METKGRITFKDGTTLDLTTLILSPSEVDSIGLLASKFGTASITKNSLVKAIEPEPFIINIRHMPTLDEVVKFIETQPDMQHSMPAISEHFIGKVLSSKKDFIQYHRLYGRVERAQKRLEKIHKGKFDTTSVSTGKNGNGGSTTFKVFSFRKNKIENAPVAQSG